MRQENVGWLKTSQFNRGDEVLTPHRRNAAPGATTSKHLLS
jgi:hypothetical protein